MLRRNFIDGFTVNENRLIQLKQTEQLIQSTINSEVLASLQANNYLNQQGQ